MANVLSLEKRAAIVTALCEGNSARATSRLADVSYDTVAKLSLELGAACIQRMDDDMRNLPCRRLVCASTPRAFIFARPEKAFLFVDGNNWYHACKAGGLRDLFALDYAKISRKLLGPTDRGGRARFGI